MSDILDHAAQVLAGVTASDAERRAKREELIVAALRSPEALADPEPKTYPCATCGQWYGTNAGPCPACVVKAAEEPKSLIPPPLSPEELVRRQAQYHAEMEGWAKAAAKMGPDPFVFGLLAKIFPDSLAPADEPKQETWRDRKPLI